MPRPIKYGSKTISRTAEIPEHVLDRIEAQARTRRITINQVIVETLLEKFNPKES